MNINEISHPNGTYIKLIPDSKSKSILTALQSQFKIPHPLHPNDLHMTLVYSRASCPDAVEIEQRFSPIRGTLTRFDYLPNKNIGSQSLVVVLDCPEAVKLHNYVIKHYGATHDYSSYIPHITLSYNCYATISALTTNPTITFDNIMVSKNIPTWKPKESNNK